MHYDFVHNLLFWGFSCLMQAISNTKQGETDTYMKARLKQH